MKSFSLIFGLMAVPLALGGPALAARGDVAPPLSTFHAAPTPPVLSFVEPGPAPVRLAQVGDPRVVGLEEQVRQLTGRVEEMNFQMLQMQEQLRKMQEDVDFRLQEIEQKRGDAGRGAPRSVAETPAAPAQPTPTEPRVVEAPSAPSAPAQGPGRPERPLGAIVFDADGNVVGGELDPEILADQAVDDEPDNEIVAALPSTDDPREVYRGAYELILSGDYGAAEAGFRQHIASFPDDAQTSDARYWLGEALLGQQRYRDAAEIFVETSRQFPESRKAPDMLLKLGVSLAALKQRDVACATFAKIGERYPAASASLKERVKQERAQTGC